MNDGISYIHWHVRLVSIFKKGRSSDILVKVLHICPSQMNDRLQDVRPEIRNEGSMEAQGIITLYNGIDMAFIKA